MNMKNSALLLAAVAVTASVASCSHDDADPKAKPSSSATTTAAPAVDIAGIQNRSATQIDADNGTTVLAGQTKVACPAPPSAAAGTEINCTVTATALTGNTMDGTATVTLSDPTGKAFSLVYKVADVNFSAEGTTTAVP